MDILARYGYIDDASDRRLILSGPADLDRVDALRASCDAILVGAGTIRADNPRLLPLRSRFSATSIRFWISRFINVSPENFLMFAPR